MNDETAYNRTLQQVIDLFINPEIKRRFDAGLIAKLPMALWGVQVILPGDGSEHKVRLNEELQGSMVAVTKPGVPTAPGTPVALTDLAAIEKLVLSEPGDANASHITVVWLGDKVFLSFDARRNRQVASALVKASEEFLEAARHAKDTSKSWSVLVDTLFSSLELSVKAFLWTVPWGLKFKARMHHTEIRSTLSQFPTALNNMGGSAQALELLASERNTARYVHGEIDPKWDLGEEWFKEAEAMLQAAKGQVNESGQKLRMPVIG
jgi:hypothetical protein